MAKGQQRISREKKKPKQDKVKTGGQSAYKSEFSNKPSAPAMPQGKKGG
jgi:hypothetical protein